MKFNELESSLMQARISQQINHFQFFFLTANLSPPKKLLAPHFFRALLNDGDVKELRNNMLSKLLPLHRPLATNIHSTLSIFIQLHINSSQICGFFMKIDNTAGYKCASYPHFLTSYFR